MHPPRIWSIGAWFLGWVLLRRLPRLPPEEGGAAGESSPVTVIVPARNEAASLPGLLDDVAANRPPGAQVVVIDDHSEDETAEIAAAYDFVDVVQPPRPEPGWTGKANAC